MIVAISCFVIATNLWEQLMMLMGIVVSKSSVEGDLRFKLGKTTNILPGQPKAVT